MTAPAIPQSFNIQQANGQVYLTWGIVAGAATYDVERSTDGVTYASVGTPSVNSYLDTTATLNTLYYYKVASVSATADTSGYTDPKQAIPTLTGKLSLGQIRLMSQQRADRVNSNFVTMPEWNTYINQSYFELYDLLTTTFEDYYLAPPLSFQTDGNYMYDLPDGTNYSGAPAFYKLSGVDCGLNDADNAFITLNRFEFIDRNKFIFPNVGSSFFGVFNLKYKIMADKIHFIPVPAANQQIRLWYQPRLTELLQDTDVVDGVSGWTEYIITDAAIKALQKEESPVDVLFAQKMALIKRIEASAANRDIGQPATISDARKNNRWGQGGGSGGSSAGW